MCCGSTDDANSCTGNNISVTIGDQCGAVSWVLFEKSYNVGQFANGDYWIAPAEGKSSVTISALSVFGSGAVTLDEIPSENQPVYSVELKVHYSALENIADDLPMSFAASTSLVAAAQKEAVHGRCGTRAIEGNCADAYHVITILSDVPPQNGSNSLRPSISNLNKDITRLMTLHV